MEITFEFITGQYAGKKYRFSKDNIVVGRSPEVDLPIDSDIVSFEHCRFTVKADGIYLTDLKSSNGTLVNGSPHDSGFLADGDKVRFGKDGPEARVFFSGEGRALKGAAMPPSQRSTPETKLDLCVDGGRVHEFPPGKISIGREDSCDLCINHTLVSRVHGEISYKPPEIYYRDLNSTNGSYLNGKRISTANLQSGDVLVLGDDGPRITIGKGKQITRGKSSGAFRILLPIILVLLLLFIGYRYLYTPRQEEKKIDSDSLQDYVTSRLMQLSRDLGDPQDEIPLIFVESTVKYINKFTSNLRTWYEVSLRRSDLHISMVRRMLRGSGLPEEFAYLAFVESGYDSTATSPAGARGLWQFMPPTARDFGLRVEKGGIDERIDPKKTTEAACKYIKQLYNLYNSYMLAMASYNTGQGRIANALMRMDVIDQNRFWYLVKNGMLHEETMEYVPKIMAAMIIATDRGKFGFSNPDPGK